MENVWVVFALFSAFCLATSDAITKKVLATNNEYVVAWLRLFYSLPLLVLCLFFIPVPRLDATFFRAFGAALPLEITATIFYMKALKASPLSLTLPFLSLTPVFLIIVPYIVLGEKLSVAGTAGVLLIAAGGYALNITKMKEGLWAPFAAIRKEKGSLFMIIVAFLYSFTSSLGKAAIDHSDPVFFGITYYIVLFIFLTPVVAWKARKELRGLRSSGAVKGLILPGMIDSFMNVTHMTAMSLTKVAYMISVKRLSLLIGVFYGYLFFKEKGMKERFFGASLMLGGFVIIMLYH